jgi:hypothetical protein
MKIAPALVVAACAMLGAPVLTFAQTAQPETPATDSPAAPVPVAPEPALPTVNVAQAVSCQVLIGQFDDSVKAAKVDDTAKAKAQGLRNDANKACNAWDYDSGLGNMRVALETIGKKPVR